MLRGAPKARLRLGPVQVPLVDLVASVLLVLTSLTLLHNQPITAVQQLALICAGLAVLARDHHSWLAAAVLLAAASLIVVGGAGVIDCGELLPALALVAYSGGASRSRRTAGLTLAIIVAATSVELLQDPVMRASSMALFLPLMVVVWAAGRGSAALRRRALELEQRTAQLTRQRSETATLAVELERSRLESELQTAIIDGLRLMLEATADARHGGRALPDALVEVENRGRMLLDDMRGMLGGLRRHSGGPQRAPQPSLGDLDRLIAQARSRGIAVSLRHEGEVQPLAAVPDRSAYRIIERALEWPSAAPMDVCVSWRPAEVQVQIQAAASIDWSGLLAAVGERATICGGHVAALRSTNGLAGLRAHLPLAGVRA